MAQVPLKVVVKQNVNSKGISEGDKVRITVSALDGGTVSPPSFDATAGSTNEAEYDFQVDVDRRYGVFIEPMEGNWWVEDDYEVKKVSRASTGETVPFVTRSLRRRNKHSGLPEDEILLTKTVLELCQSEFDSLLEEGNPTRAQIHDLQIKFASRFKGLA